MVEEELIFMLSELILLGTYYGLPMAQLYAQLLEVGNLKFAAMEQEVRLSLGKIQDLVR
jgi:hypothetical protein